MLDTGAFFQSRSGGGHLRQLHSLLGREGRSYRTRLLRKFGILSVSIVHITDLFITLILWAGLNAPKDREIDGMDQRAFLRENKRPQNREGFLYGIGNTLRSQVA